MVDTEKKTTKERFTSWGVDTTKIALLRPYYLEEAYDGIDKWVSAIKGQDPDSRILIIFDSLGNTPSIKEVETDVDDTLQLGLAAKINKRGLRRIVPTLDRDKIHYLIINQTYNHIGLPGKSDAGGKSANYYAFLIYHTARFKWLEKGVGNDAKRYGAKVKWTLKKNHFLNGPVGKSELLDITKDGIKLVGSKK